MERHVCPHAYAWRFCVGTEPLRVPGCAKNLSQGMAPRHRGTKLLICLSGTAPCVSKKKDC